MSSSTPAKLQQQRSFNLVNLDRCVDKNLVASPITASGAAATVGAQSDPTQVALFHAFVKALRPSIRGAFIATHSPQAVVDCMRGVFGCAVLPRAPGAIVAHVEAAPSASGGVDGEARRDEEPQVVEHRGRHRGGAHVRDQQALESTSALFS